MFKVRWIGFKKQCCGMQISECLRLRVKDIHFDQMLIEIHNSKGNKSRFAPLPKQLVEPLRRLVKQREELHQRDETNGVAWVWLPNALASKYPNAHREFKWQFLFASARFSKDRKTGPFRAICSSFRYPGVRRFAATPGYSL